MDFISDPSALTPIERRGDFYFKRDDLFKVAGVRGGKVRTALRLSKGAVGLVTAGSRKSPQVNIIAHISWLFKLPCQLHVPSGGLTPELIDAKQYEKTEIVQHNYGRNTVIISRARKSALQKNWTYIPFGMECSQSVEETSNQCKNIPSNIKRIVIPLGSGMSACGVSWGMRHSDVEIIGIRTGANPEKRIKKWGCPLKRIQIIDAGVDYHKEVHATLEGINLDPVYEAKCLKFLQPGDLFWIVGIRATEG